MEFIALGVATEVVVVIEYQNPCIWPDFLAVEVSSCQSAHPRAHYDQIIVLVQKLVIIGLFAPPTKGMGHFVGSLVATSHTRQGRRIVASGRGRRGN